MAKLTPKQNKKLHAKPKPSAMAPIAITKPPKPKADKRHTTPHPDRPGFAVSGRILPGPAATSKPAPKPRAQKKVLLAPYVGNK